MGVPEMLSGVGGSSEDYVLCSPYILIVQRSRVWVLASQLLYLSLHQLQLSPQGGSPQLPKLQPSLKGNPSAAHTRTPLNFTPYSSNHLVKATQVKSDLDNLKYLLQFLLSHQEPPPLHQIPWDPLACICFRCPARAPQGGVPRTPSPSLLQLQPSSQSCQEQAVYIGYIPIHRHFQDQEKQLFCLIYRKKTHKESNKMRKHRSMI